ncbi:hypothetical protein UCDDS831_g01089 [Diplodia seriata]|uniref:Uncharacterized protein n=1 Tax=Diplodia seriata TaxID=420778 RepID=A0A0G2HE97_9PEZI|nr:hypothetical protein UCDDS831_g01089 [Diplodia seriata]
MPLLKTEKSPRDSFVSSHSRSGSSAAVPPPAYGEQQTDGPSNEAPALPSDFTSRLQSLNIDPLRRQGVPAPDECIVHLKLLEAFYNLRQDVETSEGIFDIATPTPPTEAPKYEKTAPDQENEPEDGTVDEELKYKIKQVREKRWAVYVSRAVERYEQWFLEHIPKLTGGKMEGPITGTRLLEDPTLHETAGFLGERLRNFFPENLPPLDVLMVWHAHTLNPRIFFEDCLRHGCLDFWATGLPWADINTCIDNTTFDYDVGEPVKAMWRHNTQLSWDNLDDPSDKEIRCPFCTQATFLKYKNFFRIMAEYPKKMAVPTLDVDLAWHTHQTLPSNYYNFCQTNCNGVFIDHDDKVEEAKLDESFEWTSKTYQRLFGEPYSECTCWYCEAIRESHTTPLSRLFRTTNHSASASLHEADADHPSDPHSGPHISSHNSVRTNNSYAWSASRRSHLEKAFAAAVRRAKKEGREPPVREEYYAAHAAKDPTARDLGSSGDDKKKGKDNGSAYPYAYGACAPFVGYGYGMYPLGGVGARVAA